MFEGIRVGFTGTQNGMTLRQKISLYKALAFLITEYNISEVHHGSCIGADTEFHYIAKSLNLDVIIHPPKDRSKMSELVGTRVMPPKDYLKRNQDIVDSSDMLFGTPKSGYEELRSGTWATIRYGIKVGTKLRIIYPDGVISSVMPAKLEE